MKIVIVIGTRPEAIKLWPLIVEFDNSEHEITVISTGQQRALLLETLNDLGIKPDFNLEIMKEDLSLLEFLNLATLKISEIVNRINPSLIVVQGDTSSALSGALAGHLLKIPVGHVEAGLRSGDLMSPWPEEGNRRLIDSISTLLWQPTTSGIQKVEKDQIFLVTGNTVVDALRLLTSGLKQPGQHNGPIIATLHRRESFGKQMTKAMNELKELSNIVSNEIIFIEHPNPQVRKSITDSQLVDSRIQIIEPIAYTKFIKLLCRSSLLITDSGGLQEEAYSLGIPFLVMRDKTERAEALGGNLRLLVGSDGKSLIEETVKILKSPKGLHAEVKENEFGDGHAARKIRDSIENWYKNA
jgi:UDP-N-acetylglucosamine 2-epimerase